MIVTFCGHSQITQKERVLIWLRTVTSRLIEEGATTFYLGGYGDFDHLAVSALREQKLLHKEIELTLVLAYLPPRQDTGSYDSTVYPPLEKVPLRYAISHRNRWMVKQADIVVNFVLHDWGGAAAALRYAKSQNKRILSYPGR